MRKYFKSESVEMKGPTLNMTTEIQSIRTARQWDDFIGKKSKEHKNGYIHFQLYIIRINAKHNIFRAVPALPQLYKECNEN